MNLKYILGFVILFTAALAQSGSTSQAREAADAMGRQSSIRHCLEELERQERMDNMPGVNPTVEHKLLRVLAEEVLSLRQENAALKQAIEQSKKKS